MTESSLVQRLLLGCVVVCAAELATAQAFTHKREADHFEAHVTPDRLVVRERYRGATTIDGGLSCPLGPGVKAVILPGTDGRLCLHFSKDTCEYTRFQNGEPVHKEELANAVQPRMCIALASSEEAKELAALVNLGPRPQALPGIGSTQSSALHGPFAAAPAQAPVSKADTRVPEPQQSKAASPAPAAKVDAAPAAPAGKGDGAPAAPVAKVDAAPASPAGKGDGAAAAPAPGRSITHGYTASGKWLTESFVVGPSGNRRMTERTYASAYVLDDKPGRPPGRYLYIRNKSSSHLLFYGLGSGPQSRLEPGGEALVTLAYGAAAQAQSTQTVTLLWFDRN